ncbi:hypothetical protein GXM_05496 [Nostoc sphaeroides CCNUC1]|uniref:Uncharacterized protein n=1 Tax=Nostoc sphaeroides CCNUC1 TaxID=2653204 RepID=A0A5P8W5T1_9NOSO|nr:hypothetical protein GXM_05496 [Nostoc sphaeroides CCNUC1]
MQQAIEGIYKVNFEQFLWRMNNANRYKNVVWFDGFMCR